MEIGRTGEKKSRKSAKAALLPCILNQSRKQQNQLNQFALKRGIWITRPRSPVEIDQDIIRHSEQGTPDVPTCRKTRVTW